MKFIFKKLILISLVVGLSSINFGQNLFEDKLGGMKIAEKARLVHGGKKLDSLKTLKIIGKTSNGDKLNYDVKILFDIPNNLTRYEEWAKGKLITVSQFKKEGTEYKGWYFFKTDSEQVKTQDVAMVRSWSAVFSNILNLRKENLTKVKIVNSYSIFEKNPSAKITAVINENQPDMDIYNWIFDKNNRMIGDSFSVSQTKLKQILCSDFRKINGILFPTSCLSGEDLPMFSVIFDLKTAIVNPTFSKKDWITPSSKK